MLNGNAQPLSSRNGRPVFLRFTALMLALVVITAPAIAAERLRVMIETDAGGNPDDGQSLVRFLLSHRFCVDEALRVKVASLTASGSWRWLT